MHRVHPFALAALLAVGFLAIAAAPDCRAQQTEVAGSPHPTAKKASFLAWAKNNHLNYYVAGYSAVMAIAAGLVISGLAYRFSEHSKSYKLAKTRSTAWAVALGLGLGVTVAVMQVPSTQQGKLRSLLISVGVATLVTPAVTHVSFIIFRRLHIYRRGDSARPSSDRMDLL